MKFNFLEAQADAYEREQEAYSEAIDEKVVELLNTKAYDPFSLLHIIEALDSRDGLTTEQEQELKFAFESGDHRKAGKMIADTCLKYWSRCAENNAINNYNMNLG